jgi:hypothetical protein
MRKTQAPSRYISFQRSGLSGRSTAIIS